MISDKYQAVIEKIDRETEKDVSNRALMAIAEYLRGRIKDDETYADAILSENHTVSGAYNKMYSEACKNRNGKSCVCIAPDEAAIIIDEYYGIGEHERPQAETVKANEPQSQTSEDSGIVDLFDLI